ncbi:MAG: TFIIB-type zinc ribbon-containing protein [Thermoplasmatota archaeon]
MGKKILMCPKCGSTDIVPEAGFVTGYKYHCEECEYVGPFILEVDEDDEFDNDNE